MLRWIATASVMAMAAHSFPAYAQSQTPADVKAFTAMTAATTESAAPSLATMRTTARVLALRKLIAEQVAGGTIALPFEAVVPFVCDQRVDYWRLKGQANVLVSVNSSLSDLYKDAPEESKTVLGRLAGLFKSIFATVATRDLKLEPIKNRKYTDVCQADFKSFDKAVYPEPLKLTTATPIAAGLDAVSTVLDVIEPPIKQLLAIVNAAQRRRAVTAFFDDKGNRGKIIGAADALTELVRAQNMAQRQLGLAGIVEVWSGLGAAKKVAEFKGCEGLSQASTGKGDMLGHPPQFYACVGAVLSAYEKPLKALLEQAANYDNEADVGVLAKAAKESHKSFVKAISSLRSRDEKVNFIQNLDDYLQLAVAIEKAASEDSRNKIRAAVDKAFGRS